MRARGSYGAGHRRGIWTVLSLCLLVGGGTETICFAQVNAQVNAPESLQKAIRAGQAGCVAVSVFRSTPDFPLLAQQDPVAVLLSGRRPAPVPIRFGAGLVIRISEDGKTAFVLTCAHLLEPLLTSPEDPATVQAFVSFGANQTARATLRALDGRSDLAVLQVPVISSSTRPVRLGNAAHLSPGSTVLSLGDPRGIAEESRCAAGRGMVSRWQKNVLPMRPSGTGHQTDPLATLGEWLRIDASVGRTLSGGTILNLQGECVGITTALPDVAAPNFDMQYAIPGTPAIHRVIEDLLAGHEVEYGFLGVQPEAPLESPVLQTGRSSLTGRLPVDSADAAGAPSSIVPNAASAGVSVEQVSENSPASRAGLQPRDRILQINQTPIQQGMDLHREVALLGAGTPATLTVFRPETQERLELQVTLGKWPSSPTIPQRSTIPRRPDWRGLRLDAATAGLHFNSDGFIAKIPHGVLIQDVRPGSPAQAADLKIGEFIAKVGEQPVETLDEFQQALEYWPGAVPVTLADGREVMIADAR